MSRKLEPLLSQFCDQNCRENEMLHYLNEKASSFRLINAKFLQLEFLETHLQWILCPQTSFDSLIISGVVNHSKTSQIEGADSPYC